MIEKPKAIIEYCPMCDSNYLSDLPHYCTMIISKPTVPSVQSMSDEASREVWNAAIEAAAKCVEQANRDGPYQAIASHREIRKLKK